MQTSWINIYQPLHADVAGHVFASGFVFASHINDTSPGEHVTAPGEPDSPSCSPHCVELQPVGSAAVQVPGIIE